ncbi:polar amino acid transport system permease protein [Rhizobium leguminosarum]|uniref:Polar amino acid transport system permease protein n=1 Tax=Rhizobium leguminosarum TaxID=384 RepID=A0AAE2SW59_RHILE|nr:MULTISPECIES: amino acid ABC transporter permease [Rhizobium]MBB4290170.1 polar amino acid transport system permease protein [Rhizobium leguminosarum]MBB4296813.1 polar amino acid transport system permease protein [Rhizobium leguminosarum]MBB4307925.1 polar amino acid transport system permease protein [Rhizobium leguminosarum]MBB4415761.1 polar amino acid transport system permease protein [Rhizobium leguminosarum]MBB4431272.1 polar amino acid transport system permease protein [Rhizobium esp
MGPIGENELFFLLQGLKWTVLLAIIGFVGGGVFGILIALVRTSKNRFARFVSSGYIALFQGTPLLMQLFVVYYGVALLGVDVNAWIAVAIAFTLHASAFLGEIWRGSIEAVPKGQTEAANALGLHYISRMRDVILPQALKISMPATIGFLVQLIKGTSLAAIVGFIELTRAGQIISNQTYRPLLVFGIVGIIYFIICWPLSHIGSGLEKRMAKAVR